MVQNVNKLTLEYNLDYISSYFQLRKDDRISYFNGKFSQFYSPIGFIDMSSNITILEYQ